MRVLITGAGGFVGRHLAATARDAGAVVVGLGRERPGSDALSESHAVDLLDAGATGAAVAAAEPDLVFHLAARASVAESWRAPDVTLSENVVTTQHLLDAVRTRAPDAAVLVAGSGEQYGAPAPEDLPVSELQPLRPLNPYALSKAAAELVGGFFANAHGLRVVRTRAFNHAGPGQSQTYVVSALARRVAEAELENASGGPATIDVGNTAAARDFTDVRDVARAYWSALQSGAAAVYNVCSGTATTVATLIERLRTMTDLEIQTRTDPGLLRPQDVLEVRGSAAKLEAATGWRPEIPLDRTIADTLDWWRAELGS
ncbi:MAG TPA: GDP-mannose 4,6-dehydratase [Thermoleophilaceae bacterium]